MREAGRAGRAAAEARHVCAARREEAQGYSEGVFSFLIRSFMIGIGQVIFVANLFVEKGFS